MEFRVLDECVEIEGAGVMLFAAEEDSLKLTQGCTIRDIRGNSHTVDGVSLQEGLGSLYLRTGNAAYFQRLFRDIFVDATLFTAECAEGGH